MAERDPDTESDPESDVQVASYEGKKYSCCIIIKFTIANVH
jgi:hypothetical protein